MERRVHGDAQVWRQQTQTGQPKQGHSQERMSSHGDLQYPGDAGDTDTPETPGWQHSLLWAAALSRSKGCELLGSAQQFWSCFLMVTSAPRQTFALQQQGTGSRALQTHGARTAQDQELPCPLPAPCAVHQAGTEHSQDGERFCSITQGWWKGAQGSWFNPISTPKLGQLGLWDEAPMPQGLAAK